MSSLRYEHSLSCFLYLLLLQLFVLQQLYYTETRHLLFSSTSPVWSHFRPFGSFILLSFMSELSEMNTLGQQSNLSINKKRKILSFQNIKTLTYKTLNMYCIEPPRPKSLPFDGANIKGKKVRSIFSRPGRSQVLLYKYFHPLFPRMGNFITKLISLFIS